MTHPNILLTLEEDRLRYVTVECAVCRASRSIPRVTSLPREPATIVREFAEEALGLQAATKTGASC